MQKSKLKFKNQIPKTWRKVKLGEAVEKIIDNRGKTPPLSKLGYPMIEVFQLSRDRKYPDLSDSKKQKYVSEDVYKSWFRSGHPKEEDILVSTVGTIAQWNLIPQNKKYCIAQNVVALRPDLSKTTSEFLRFYFNQRKFVSQVEGIVIGATQPSVRLPHFLNLEIEIPSLNKQKRIAEILSAFDDKIELNNKINKTLEEMASAIFKEWFVKFRFPGWEKVKFVNSELEKIPREWELKKLGEIVKLNKGLSYRSVDINEQKKGLPLINLKCFVRGGGFKIDGLKYYTGDYQNRHIVKPKQLIIAMTDLTPTREVVGRPALVPNFSNSDILISLDVVSVEVDEIMQEYLYFLMKRPDFGELMANSASGTTVAHLSKDSIENYPVIIPENDFLKKFHNITSGIFRWCDNINKENQKLASLRDLLLPKLMRGEIRV